MLIPTPSISEHEFQVIDEIDGIWRRLGYLGQSHRQWSGLLRRTAFARAVRGSNSIEGYLVSIDDAIAAAEDDLPFEATGETWDAVRCYRDAMTYVLRLVEDPHFSYSSALIRSLHYMMLKYAQAKSPGLWRPGDVYVRDSSSGDAVYTGAPADEVPGLMSELSEALNAHDPSVPGIVHAAMAHLNLVMIHPFRDGNGRMARCLQTLVLARAGTLYPPFSSIEEYLGHRQNTRAYYEVLQEVGGRRWDPDRDASPWIRFCLVAHYRQAMTVLRRSEWMRELWDLLEDELSARALPNRMLVALVDAASGFRVRNASYRSAADLSLAMASRDLKRLADASLLVAQGEKRGRHYLASDRLLQIRNRIAPLPRQIADPFELRADVA